MKKKVTLLFEVILKLYKPTNRNTDNPRSICFYTKQSDLDVIYDHINVYINKNN